MTSLTLYPQAIIFKCIKYAKCFYFSRTGLLNRSKRSKLSPSFSSPWKFEPQKWPKEGLLIFFWLFDNQFCFILVPKVYFIYKWRHHLIIMTSQWRFNVTWTIRYLWKRSYNLNFRPICTSPTSAILSQSGSSSSLDIILRIGNTYHITSIMLLHRDWTTVNT